MLTHTKVSSFAVVALLFLALMPGAPAGGLPQDYQNGLTGYSPPPDPFTPLPDSVDAATHARVEAALNQLPLYFIENQGQLDERAAYYIQASDKTIYFTPDGVTFAFIASPTGSTPPLPFPHRSREGLRDGGKDAGESAPRRWVVKLDFLGANPDARPIGQEKIDAIVSYFKGSPDQWHTGIPLYARILYRDLWPGIDLAFTGTVNQLKYEFIVDPGADPEQIRLAYRGAENVTLNDAGQLEVITPLGSFSDDPPLAYQDIDGQRMEVAAAYEIESPIGYPQFTFQIGSYDPTLPLVIDPAILIYCGYIGGSGTDRGYGIAVDGTGAAYIVGETYSSETESFPVLAGPDLTYNSSRDAFVAKVKADGTGLEYCGYIGGSDVDRGFDIAVDGTGAAYVVGDTYSSETEGFPVLVGPDLTHSWHDAFVAKVKADGTGLDYCGYIGGGNGEQGLGIAVDGTGAAYVAGWTGSSEAVGFPVLVGPDLTFNGGGVDAFVAKVKADGTGLDYCGYIGGWESDKGSGIAVDGTGAAYVVGWTNSAETEGFPVLVGPDLTHNGDYDTFVAKVKADGTGLDYSGYIGGTNEDSSDGIAVDGTGAAYIAGRTLSSETEGFPLLAGPDLTYNSGRDAFVAKVKADGTGLDYCGYIGGSDTDVGLGIAVDGTGAAYVTGWTQSSETEGFPVLVGPDLTYNGDGSDAFVAKIKANGTGLDYCGYIGGTDEDNGYDIAVDKTGAAYIVGETYASEVEGFPVLVGPDLSHNGGGVDAFVAKVSKQGPELTNRVYLPFLAR